MPLAYQSSPLSLGTTQHEQKLSSLPAPSWACTYTTDPLAEAAPEFAFPSSLFAGCSGRLSCPMQASCLGLCHAALFKRSSLFQRPHLHLWFNSNVINTMKPPLTTTPSQKSPVVFSLSPILCRKRTLSAPLCHLPLSARCGICTLVVCIGRGHKLYPHVSVKHLLRMNPALMALTG